MSQPERDDTGTQLRVGAISGIHQDDASRQARVAGGDDLIESDHRLGLEADVFRNANSLPARGIVGPVLRQKETIGDWKARCVVCDRQRDGDLTVVLLAELAGILARHADRMPAFLWKAGVVDDPGLDLPWTAGVTIAATLAMTVSSDQGDCPTK